MLANPAVIKHLETNYVPVGDLRVRLDEYFETVPTYPADQSHTDTQPNTEFQRATQSAISRVQHAGRDSVGVFDILAAFLDTSLGLSVTQLLADVTAPASLEKVRQIKADLCALCNEPTTPDSWTVVENRGVLCLDCLNAVLAAYGKQ
jgi:hypothetical protein